MDWNARLLAKSCVTSLMQPGPVPISLVDVFRDRLRPGLLHAFAVVEIQFALHNRPRFRIDWRSVALADTIGTVPAVLGCVLFRVSRKLIAIFRAGEPPRG